MGIVDDEAHYLTPEQLADELGVAAKEIRKWLRTVEMRPEVEKHQPWKLTQEEAGFVRRQFS